MQNYQPGVIVLIAFPFAGERKVKKRPDLVLLDTGDDDVVVARITSKQQTTSHDVEIEKWEKAGLLIPSVVRLHKVATLGKNLVDRTLGTLESSDWKGVLEVLKNICKDLG